MLNNWAAKRKVGYLFSFLGALVLLIGIPVALFIYRAPTCFDGRQNQGELGVDCGGPCVRLCPVTQLPPVIEWSRPFEVVPGYYSAAAYVTNPNPTAEARNVPYRFRLFDESGVLSVERTGTAYIPPRKSFAIIETGFRVNDRKIARVDFEFTKTPEWTRQLEVDPSLSVRNVALSRENSAPRVDATLVNNTVSHINAIDISAVIYDSRRNAIAVSKTVVEDLRNDESRNIVFTWPTALPGSIGVCEQPVDVMLSIDRSGSMSFDGQDPPQPLTAVKQAAISFVDELQDTDKAGVVTFATEGSNPIDQFLTSNFARVKEVITGIYIRSDAVQNTNISDGIRYAFTELQSERRNPIADKVIVLLTDGVATHPVEQGNEQYPETHAIGVANEAKSAGVQLYTIGLGNNLNEEFLKNIASSPNHYFNAPTSQSLGAVYRQIATLICEKNPSAIIEILPQVRK